METRDYKLEVVTELLSNPSHARELARKIRISHTGIIKNLRELRKTNVVDYVIKGKNKVYSLKKTVEAKAYAIMAENYKLVKTINKYPILRSIIERIQKNDEIRIALLFGSYAKGNASKDSDIDVYVETEDNKLKKELELINTKLNVKIGVYDELSLLIKEINKNHVVIKGAEDYYAKRKLME